MFSEFLDKLGLHNKVANDDDPSRRRFTRRSCDHCVSVVGDKIYPVEDWSLGGVLLQARPEDFGLEEEHDVMLKFKLSDNLLDIPHKARVVRKTNQNVALEFRPLTKPMRDSFQTVIDDYVATQFANSQA